jgi:hypothetical protein
MCPVWDTINSQPSAGAWPNSPLGNKSLAFNLQMFWSKASERLVLSIEAFTNALTRVAAD